MTYNFFWLLQVFYFYILLLIREAWKISIVIFEKLYAEAKPNQSQVLTALLHLSLSTFSPLWSVYCMLQKQQESRLFFKKEKSWIWFPCELFVSSDLSCRKWECGLFFFIYPNALAISFSTFMPAKHLKLNCTEGKRQKDALWDVTGDPFLSCALAFCFPSLPAWQTGVQWWDWNTPSTLRPAANAIESIWPPLPSFPCHLELFWTPSCRFSGGLCSRRGPPQMWL